jgi:hypothetical protein
LNTIRDTTLRMYLTRTAIRSRSSIRADGRRDDSPETAKQKPFRMISSGFQLRPGVGAALAEDYF